MAPEHLGNKITPEEEAFVRDRAAFYGVSVESMRKFVYGEPNTLKRNQTPLCTCWPAGSTGHDASCAIWDMYDINEDR